MHHRAPAARHRHEVAIDARAGHLDRGHAPATQRARDHGAFTRVDHRRDLDAELAEHFRALVAAIAVSEHDCTAAGRHRIPAQIGFHRTRQHDARTIVAAEHQRPLVRSRREHHALRAEVPQAPLPPRVALDRAEEVVVVVAEHGGARERRDASHLLQRAFVAQDDARAALRRLDRRRAPGAAAAHHQHVAVPVHLVVAVGIGLRRRGADARHAPDRRLVERLPQPPGPHERLVIEAGNQERREPAVDGTHIETQAGPAIERLCHQSVVELDQRRAAVGIEPPAFADGDQRVGLLDAGAHHAARAVVLEAAADEEYVVREQRRRERVALEALQWAAVEAEAQLLAAIDAPAVG